jgi:DNA primase
MGSDASPPANVIFNSKFSIYEMKYDELNLQKLRALPIFEVCSKLGITLYGMGKLTRRATCWYHADKHPSMHVNKKKNIYKCFVCGKGGDVIRLVQDYDNKTFIEACDWLVNEFHVILIENKPSAKSASSVVDKTEKSASSAPSVVVLYSCNPFNPLS